MAKISLPESLKGAAAKLAADDEIGMWRLDPALVESADLRPGGPISLYAIGEDGLGDFLCLYPSRFVADAAVPVTMWNPESRQLTMLGNDVADFLEKESHRRLSFLLERVEPLSESMVAAARQGESPSLDAIEVEKRVLAGMLCDVCRVAGKLGLSESIYERAAGKAGLPSFLREVDGGDEGEIDKALGELGRSAMSGDGSAALEITAFHQVRQKDDEAVRWAFKLNKCSLFTWPDFSLPMLGKVIEMIKGNSAAIEAKDRLDPLFGFLTSQQAHKPEQRLNLAKQYLRKKDFASAAREAENALRLSPVERASLRPAYELLKEIFTSANRPNEVEYVETMLAKSDVTV